MSLKIFTANVRGLRDPGKQSLLRAMSTNADIIGLTETHTDAELSYSFSFSLFSHPFSSIFTSASSSRLGVGFIYNTNKLRLISHTADPGGRYIVTNLELLSESLHFSCVIVYAPDKAAERVAWISAMPQWLPQGVPLILAGDFNFVESLVDRFDGRPGGGLKGSSEFAEIVKIPYGLSDCGPFNGPSSDRKVTFLSNKSWTARLDRVYVTSHLMSHHLNTQIADVPISDHIPVVSQFDFREIRSGSGYWKFNASMLHDSRFTGAVKEVISDSVALDPLQRWSHIKSTVRALAQFYGSMLAGERNTRELVCTESVIKLTESLIKDNSPANRLLLAEAQAELRTILSHKAAGACVRRRAQWDSIAELPSAYFSRFAEQRATSSAPRVFVDQHNNQYSTVEGMLQHASHEYTEIYKHEESDAAAASSVIASLSTRLLDQDRVAMDAVISEDEVLQAIHHLKRGSSPGIDGFTAEFYKHFARDLAPVLLGAFNKVLADGIMPEEWRTGVITLIPKGVNNLERLSNWRPITLLCVDYKILSTIFSHRLRNILSSLIHFTQTGFVPGRSIFDNVLEVLYLHDQGSEGALLAFLDFQKAFDLISHSSLIAVLRKYGFGERFIHVICTFLNSIKSVINIAGNLSADIPVQRGVRQGDPISPFLFVLAVEVMHAAIRADNSEGITVGGHTTKSRGFADDTALAAASVADLQRMLEVVTKYCKASTSRLNLSKSHLLPAKRTTEVLFPTMHVVDDSPVKYLGYLINRQGMVSRLGSIINSIKRTLEHWRKFNLTLFGKVNVLKCYALSKLWYQLYVDSLDNQKVKEINNLIAWFLWYTQKPYSSAIVYSSPISMSRLLNLRQYGGLSLWDVQVKAQTLKASLVIKYIKSTERLSWMSRFEHYLSATREEMDIFCSPLVRQDLQSKLALSFRPFNNLIYAFAEFELIRDLKCCPGSIVATWNKFDNYSRIVQVVQLLPKERIECIDLLTNRKLIRVQDNIMNISFVNNIACPLSESEWRQHISALGWYNFGDVRQVSLSDNLSVKLLYQILYYDKYQKGQKLLLTNTQKLYPIDYLQVWQMFVKLSTRNKIKEFIWSSLNNNINVNAVVSHFIAGVTSKCPLCPGKETVNHRLITCDYTASITNQFRSFWQTITRQHLPVDFNLLNAHKIEKRQQLLINLYSIILYSTWLFRNNKAFNNPIVPISHIIEKELRRFYAKISFCTKLNIENTQNTQQLSIIDKVKRKWSNTMFDFDQNANVIVQYSYNWN